MKHVRVHVHVCADAMASEALDHLKKNKGRVSKRRCAERHHQAHNLTPNPSFLHPAAIMCPMTSNGTPGPQAEKKCQQAIATYSLQTLPAAPTQCCENKAPMQLLYSTCNRLHHAFVRAIYEGARGRGWCAGVERMAVVTMNSVHKAAKCEVKKRKRYGLPNIRQRTR